MHIFRSLIATLTISFLLIGCSSTRITQNSITNQLHDNVFKASFTGLIIIDPENAETIIDYNADKYFIPASNIKLYTFYAGLKTLGDSVPALKYTKIGDSLIFTGTGDPSFFYNDLEESKVYSFLKHSKETLFYKPQKEKIPQFGPGWAWDDYNEYYSAERSSFPIYGNLVNFTFNYKDSTPVSTPQLFQKNVLATVKSSSNIKRDLDKNEFYYNPQSFSRTSNQKVPFKTSSSLFIQLLSDTLNKPVELLEPDVTFTQDPKILYSVATDSLYKKMLQESDNFIAEQLLLMVSNKTFGSFNSTSAIELVKERYLNDLPDEPKWVDGSGLSRYNLVTPRTTALLLDKIYKELPKDRIFNLFPAGGVSGTLKNQFKAEEPYVYAKTGTLSNNHSLSGYLITKKGRILIFSFMNNNYTVPTSQIKSKMEEILKSVHENL
jgi:serine-type D-Ala-D-Ala carboxypeptidase/endopeptidase (penicillin-binding protein 4)